MNSKNDKKPSPCSVAEFLEVPAETMAKLCSLPSLDENDTKRGGISLTSSQMNTLLAYCEADRSTVRPDEATSSSVHNRSIGTFPASPFTSPKRKAGSFGSQGVPQQVSLTDASPGSTLTSPSTSDGNFSWLNSNLAPHGEPPVYRVPVPVPQAYYQYPVESNNGYRVTPPQAYPYNPYHRPFKSYGYHTVPPQVSHRPFVSIHNGYAVAPPQAYSRPFESSGNSTAKKRKWEPPPPPPYYPGCPPTKESIDPYPKPVKVTAWACDVCKKPFLDYDEACRHELQCHQHQQEKEQQPPAANVSSTDSLPGSSSTVSFFFSDLQSRASWKHLPPSSPFERSPGLQLPLIGNQTDETYGMKGPSMQLRSLSTSPSTHCHSSQDPSHTTLVHRAAPSKESRHLPDVTPSPRRTVANEWDIVVGLDGRVSNENEGGRRFLQLIHAMAAPYRQVFPKPFKTSLSKAIVEFVQSYGGRFVYLSEEDDDEPNTWYLLDDDKARSKTSQTLRETKLIKWTRVHGLDFWKVPKIFDGQTTTTSSMIHGQPRRWDVICGRGGGANNKEGNVRYRGIVEAFRLPYATNSNESETLQVVPMRIKLIDAIVNYVKGNGGRFRKIVKDGDSMRLSILVSAKEATAQELLHATQE